MDGDHDCAGIDVGIYSWYERIFFSILFSMLFDSTSQALVIEGIPPGNCFLLSCIIKLYCFLLSYY